MIYRISSEAEAASDNTAGPLLALETATRHACLALMADGAVVAEQSVPIGSHAACLPGFVARLMSAAGVQHRLLRVIAVGIGPGSYTGLRVGLSYAKGLAMACGAALAGVPTLDSLALGASQVAGSGPGSLICALLDARRGEVYAGLYRLTPGGLEKLSEDSVTTPDRLARKIDSDCMVLVGDDAARGVASAMRGLRRNVCYVGLDDLPLGRSVAALGAALAGRDQTNLPSALEPLYLKSAETIFKPSTDSAGIGAEEIWKAEKRNSFNS
jgi:tRNA threonylcarbamoyladenosine biosynthesis protein TsaB